MFVCVCVYTYTYTYTVCSSYYSIVFNPIIGLFIYIYKIYIEITATILITNILLI